MSATWRVECRASHDCHELECDPCGAESGERNAHTVWIRESEVVCESLTVSCTVFCHATVRGSLPILVPTRAKVRPVVLVRSHTHNVDTGTRKRA
jgi:hypothetical protein